MGQPSSYRLELSEHRFGRGLIGPGNHVGGSGRRGTISNVIRNVVVGRLNPGLEPAAIEPGLAAIVALEPSGLLDCRVGRDLRLRDESWDFAITCDFVDADAYRRYDTDVEHNRIRREMFAPFCSEIARVQFSA